MSRYKVIGGWADDFYGARYVVQVSDIIDTQTNREYRDGAYRVIDRETRKPALRGKGGSVPFYGETAWQDAQRLIYDLSIQRSRGERYGL